MVKPVRLAKWSTGVIVILGVWVLATPFVLGFPPSGTLAYWSNVSSGMVIAILGAYVGFFLWLRPVTDPVDVA